jgi:hypothetical protein
MQSGERVITNEAASQSRLSNTYAVEIISPWHDPITSPRTLVQLPDIVDQIIGWLPFETSSDWRSQPGVETSRATALVCRCWLEPSRRNLFRVIRLQLDNAQACRRLLDVLQRSPEIGACIKEIRWNLQSWPDNLGEHPVELICLIASMSVRYNISHSVPIAGRVGGKGLNWILERVPELTNYIRDVTWAFRKGREDLDGFCGARALSRRLDSLTSLGVLESGTGQQIALSYTSFASALPVHAITALRLRKAIFASPSEFTHFFSAFSQLRDLKLQSISIRGSASAKDYRDVRVPPIRHLTVHFAENGIEVLWNWILACKKPVFLEYLELGQTFTTLNAEVIGRCTATLKDVILDGNMPSPIEDAGPLT